MEQSESIDYLEEVTRRCLEELPKENALYSRADLLLGFMEDVRGNRGRNTLIKQLIVEIAEEADTIENHVKGAVEKTERFLSALATYATQYFQDSENIHNQTLTLLLREAAKTRADLYDATDLQSERN